MKQLPLLITVIFLGTHFFSSAQKDEDFERDYKNLLSNISSKGSRSFAREESSLENKDIAWGFIPCDSMYRFTSTRSDSGVVKFTARHGAGYFTVGSYKTLSEKDTLFLLTFSNDGAIRSIYPDKYQTPFRTTRGFMCGTFEVLCPGTRP